MPSVATAKTKLDLYRLHAADYVARREPAIVNIVRCQYLAVDGAGIPGGSEFQACIGALYSVAFTIKMTLKFSGHDYAVCKLEGLWPDSSTGRCCGWSAALTGPPTT